MYIDSTLKMVSLRTINKFNKKTHVWSDAYYCIIELHGSMTTSTAQANKNCYFSWFELVHNPADWIMRANWFLSVEWSVLGLVNTHRDIFHPSYSKIIPSTHRSKRAREGCQEIDGQPEIQKPMRDQKLSFSCSHKSDFSEKSTLVWVFKNSRNRKRIEKFQFY